MDFLDILLSLLFMLLIVGLLGLVASITFVPKNNTAIVCRLGRDIRVLRSGFHFITPFVESMKEVTWHRTATTTAHNDGFYKAKHSGWLIPMYQVEHDPAPITVDVKDRLRVHIDVMFQSRVVDPERAVFNSVDPWSFLEKEVASILQDIFSSADMDEVRQYSMQHWTQMVVEALRTKQFDGHVGVVVEFFRIQRIEPDQSILDAEISAARQRKMSQVSYDLKVRELQNQAQLDKAQSERFASNLGRFKELGPQAQTAAYLDMQNEQEIALASRLNAIMGPQPAAQYRLAVALNRAADAGHPIQLVLPTAEMIKK